MKFKVSGTIEYAWEREVEADTEVEAERLALEYAKDGSIDLSGPFDEPEVDSVEKVD